jgi:hypothetical protein
MIVMVVGDFTFFVADHSKIQETIDEIVGKKDYCHFCQAVPITVIYRGWDDKIVAACKLHEEIVMEMIERAQHDS